MVNFLILSFAVMEDKFQVLATDYETFSVEYKCDPNGLLEKRGKTHMMEFHFQFFEKNITFL